MSESIHPEPAATPDAVSGKTPICDGFEKFWINHKVYASFEAVSLEAAKGLERKLSSEKPKSDELAASIEIILSECQKAQTMVGELLDEKEQLAYENQQARARLDLEVKKSTELEAKLAAMTHQRDVTSNYNDKIEAENTELSEAISTPEALCANILRGTIPKPDIRSLLHLHGEEALRRWDSVEELTARNHKLVEAFRKINGRIREAKYDDISQDECLIKVAIISENALSETADAKEGEAQS